MHIYIEEDHMNRMWADVFRSGNWNDTLNFVLVVALLLSLMLLHPRPGSRPRAQPVPLELAATRPEEMVRT